MTVKGLISLISSLNPALPREPSESEVSEGTGVQLWCRVACPRPARMKHSQVSPGCAVGEEPHGRYFLLSTVFPFINVSRNSISQQAWPLIHLLYLFCSFANFLCEFHSVWQLDMLLPPLVCPKFIINFLKLCDRSPCNNI